MTTGWRTSDESTQVGIARGQIARVYIDQNGCIDMVTFEVRTTDPVGFHAGYVPSVSHVGSGKDVPVDGDAILRVDINAPATTSPEVVSLNWRGKLPALQQVVSAGSFEGSTVFAIGLRQKVPFFVDNTFRVNGDTTLVTIMFANGT